MRLQHLPAPGAALLAEADSMSVVVAIHNTPLPLSLCPGVRLQHLSLHILILHASMRPVSFVTTQTSQLCDRHGGARPWCTHAVA